MSHSATKPQTKADHKLSIAHLKSTIAFNKKHIKEHKEVIGKGGSKKYNKDHIKHHKDNIKADEKLIKDRKKTLSKIAKKQFFS